MTIRNKGRDIYFAGERYAGHYGSILAEYILMQNNSDINIKGVAIGNGWLDGKEQVKSYAPFD